MNRSWVFYSIGCHLFQVGSLWSIQMLLCHRSWGNMDPEEISVVNTKQHHKNEKAWGESRWQVLWSWTAFKLAHCDWEKTKNWLTCRFQAGGCMQAFGALLHNGAMSFWPESLAKWNAYLIQNLFLRVGNSKTNSSLRHRKTSMLWFFFSLRSLCFRKLHAKSAWTAFRSFHQKLSGGLDYVGSWPDFNLFVGSVFN